VRELNDALGLRDCRLDQPMHFRRSAELFQIFPRTPGCIRHEIRKCLGPCVGGCTTREYDDRVRWCAPFSMAPTMDRWSAPCATCSGQ
jgi:excinuclease ABC subunit C